ncbi:MAG TPA: hypothetical protein VMS32_06540 [Verrucomicrobiae bacterium]|nr:hypothetical protein [Verrucomicrobiae bacterium]
MSGRLLGLIRSTRAQQFAALFLALAVVVAQGFDFANGIVKNAALLGYIVLMVHTYRERPNALLPPAAGLLILGIVLSSFATPLGLSIAEGAFTLAIGHVVSFLIALARQHRKNSEQLRNLVGRNNGLDAVRKWVAGRKSFAALDPGWSFSGRPGSSILLVVVGSLLVAAASGLFTHWRLTGAGIGAPIWNVHILNAGLQRIGMRLSDASILTPTGTAAFVAIPDAPIFDLLKLLHPAALNGVAISNVASVGCVWLFIGGVTLLLETWLPNRYACASAALLFLLQPLGYSLRIGAPFDLLVPIFVLVLAVREKVSNPVLIGAALLSGLFNVAGGYELALLVTLMWSFGYLKNGRLVGGIAAAGVISSVAFSEMVHSMAPTIALGEAWWNSDALTHLFGTGALSAPFLGIALATITSIAGIVLMTNLRRARDLWFAIALFAVSAVLAIPPHLGGVPLLLPGHVLDRITPLGWPTARFFELSVFALTIPMSFAAAALLRFLWIVFKDPRPFTIARWVVLVALFLTLVPRTVDTTFPPTPRGARVVIFPIAQAGSLASVMEADALLQSEAQILQPIPFIDGSAFAQGEVPDASTTVAKLRRLRVQRVVIVYGLYRGPQSLSVSPGLYDPRDYIEPALGSNPNFRIQLVAENSEVYALTMMSR